MSNLLEYAEDELNAAGWNDPDAMYGTMIRDAVLQLVSVFAEQGHSGMSASIVIALVEKLMRYEPLGPLTGSDDEWCVLEYSDDMYAQNKRCAHVFKRADGTAYDIDGRIFVEPDGMSYTGKNSHVDVTFPYTPTSEYVNVPAREDSDD